jgi:hypothetical protein
MLCLAWASATIATDRQQPSSWYRSSLALNSPSMFGSGVLASSSISVKYRYSGNITSPALAQRHWAQRSVEVTLGVRRRPG